MLSFGKIKWSKNVQGEKDNSSSWSLGEHMKPQHRCGSETFGYRCVADGMITVMVLRFHHLPLNFKCKSRANTALDLLQ